MSLHWGSVTGTVLLSAHERSSETEIDHTAEDVERLGSILEDTDH